ncbi:WD repeat domain-containing protein [Zalerion maritima]|uniref:WD repeat domain-containing protein n=1 Tax=Zalerion maritima TaxID=339359 RepID=A0AAD5RNE4_9PEZI|nr:WD repeat domain-containing protein [Zalerion maritima]
MEKRSIQEIQSRWLETEEKARSFSALQEEVRHNGPTSPCVSGCRSVCWRAFLVFQSDLGDGWSSNLPRHRRRYSSLRDHHLKFIENPQELNSVTDDPLADDPTSPWNTVRQDETMRQEILQDVRRLPEEPFYHLDEIQTLILDVLFIYCKLNPDTGYRQGMHELLAPLVYVVGQDSLYSSPVSADAFAVNPTMALVLDPAYVEHDSFALFEKLMSSCKPFYETDWPHGSAATLSASQNQISRIVEKSKHIHDACLSCVDPELAAHLTHIEVLPQIFLIRWIRLLFGREFPFHEQLVLWDTIFAFDPTLQIVDFICVAMLLRVRWELLRADYPAALQLLLKYPALKEPHGPHTLIEDALDLSRNPTPLGGSTIIQKYTGKAPSPKHSTSAPATLGGLAFHPSLRTTVGSLPTARAPLHAPQSSPARLFSQQEEVKALFSGAAKNVLQQSEKLGINQAVRDAVGDIRRGWTDVRSQAGTPRSSSSLAVTTALAAMERRNRQLALMLDEAFNDLKALSDDGKSGKEAIEMVAAKVHFVKVHLEDSTLVLADEDSNDKAASEDSIEPVRNPSSSLISNSATPETPPSSPPNRAKQGVLDEALSQSSAPGLDSGVPEAQSPRMTPKVETVKTLGGEEQQAGNSPSAKPTTSTTLADEDPSPVRPQALPTRSTLAQSSFAFMLEDPDTKREMGTAAGSAPPSLTVSHSRAHKRITSTGASASRGRNAFLFGEVVGTDGSGEGYTLAGTDDIFGLLPVEKGGGK